MKKHIKLVSLMLAACILTVNSTTVFAAKGTETEISPQWTDVSTITSRMEVDSWGIATISATGRASTTSSADSATLIVELQRYEDNNWNTIKSWEDNKGVKFASVTEKYAIKKGYSYRLYLTVKAYKGSKLLETATDIYNYGLYN